MKSSRLAHPHRPSHPLLAQFDTDHADWNLWAVASIEAAQLPIPLATLYPTVASPDQLMAQGRVHPGPAWGVQVVRLLLESMIEKGARPQEGVEAKQAAAARRWLVDHEAIALPEAKAWFVGLPGAEVTPERPSLCHLVAGWRHQKGVKQNWALTMEKIQWEERLLARAEAEELALRLTADMDVPRNDNGQHGGHRSDGIKGRKIRL